jgi:nucleotide-binding universal stress UspA family protein
METYPKILFPVDFSATAPIVASHAATLAKRFDSELHLLHIVPKYERHAFASYEKAMQEIKERTLADLDSFAKEHCPGINTLTNIASGHTGRQILDYAYKNDISMIIMGTHGRSEISQLIFGSVAQRVVQSSTVPVLTINPACMQ